VSKVAACIFDFNGVLYWDSDLHEMAWQQYSAQIREAPLTSREMAARVHGRTGEAILSYLLDRELSREEVDRHVERKEAIYRALCTRDGRPSLSPGATRLLDRLAAATIPRTIASASGAANMRFFWEMFSLGRWFEWDRLIYDDGSMPGKPAPDMYLAAASKLDVPPARCLVFEDSISGIASAHAAGIGRIVAVGPVSSHRQLAELAGVSDIIEDFTEAPALLDC
jgi:HAD superfamily hydrolase (TIGR01509 family)